MSDILLLLNSGLGDAVQALPAIAELHRLLPDRRFVLFGSAANVELLRSPQIADEFHILKRGQSLMRYLFTHPSALFRRYDRAFSFYSSNGGRLSLLKKAGLLGSCFSILTRNNTAYEPDKFLPDNADKSEVDMNLDLLELAGLKPDRSAVSDLFLTDAERRYGQEYFHGDAPVLIHPGWTKNGHLKALPLSFTAELIRRFPAEKNIPAKLLLGPEEFLFWREQDGGRTIPAEHIIPGGDFTMRELASVLGACRRVIAADTGPAHIAGAAGADVTVIFSASSPVHGELHCRSDVIHIPPASGLSCSGCVHRGVKSCQQETQICFAADADTILKMPNLESGGRNAILTDNIETADRSTTR